MKVQMKVTGLMMRPSLAAGSAEKNKGRVSAEVTICGDKLSHGKIVLEFDEDEALAADLNKLCVGQTATVSFGEAMQAPWKIPGMKPYSRPESGIPLMRQEEFTSKYGKSTDPHCAEVSGYMPLRQGDEVLHILELLSTGYAVNGIVPGAGSEKYRWPAEENGDQGERHDG